MKTKLLLSTLFLSIFAISGFSHGTEKHDNNEKKVVQKKEPSVNDNSEKSLEIKKALKEKETVLQNKYKKINEEYLENIKPIFEAKCFNCHSSTTNYPFYYKIPGVKNMIDKDIKEAKKHIDFSKDFPFISHETPINDLKSLNKIGQKGGMPPLRYIVTHWDSKLSKKDKESMIEWTKNAIELLGEK